MAVFGVEKNLFHGARKVAPGQEFRQIVDKMVALLSDDPDDFVLLGRLEKNLSAVQADTVRILHARRCRAAKQAPIMIPILNHPP